MPSRKDHFGPGRSEWLPSDSRDRLGVFATGVREMEKPGAGTEHLGLIGTAGGCLACAGVPAAASAALLEE